MVWFVGSLLSFIGGLYPLMAGLDDLCSCFSLTKRRKEGLRFHDRRLS